LCKWDTVAKDSIFIFPKARAKINSITIKNTKEITFDTIAKKSFPCFYDAQEIRFLANKTISIMTTKGYPFASLSIDIIPDTQSSLKYTNNHSYNIIFNINENGKYFFSSPLIIGSYTTNKRLLLNDIVFKDGSLFDYRKIWQSQLKLLSRPYISNVEVSSPYVMLESKAITEEQPDTNEYEYKDKVIVPISCTDKKGLGLDGAVAFQAGGTAPLSNFFGMISFSLLNIFGLGEKTSLLYNGQQDMQHIELFLAKPYIFNFPIFPSSSFGLEIKKNDYGYLNGKLDILTELLNLTRIGLSLQGYEVDYRLNDSIGVTSQYGGLNILISRQPVNIYEAEKFSSGFLIQTGSGIAKSKNKQFDRWNAEILAGFHIPIYKRFSIYAKITGKTKITKQEDSLHNIEMYRIGGYKSLRGYNDNEFSFTTVAYENLEFLFYFGRFSSIYLFTDAGLGTAVQKYDSFNYFNKLFGYGIGMRFPSKLGVISLEWARNYKDFKSFGRIHVSFINSILEKNGTLNADWN